MAIYSSVLMAILIASSACLASAQSQSSVAIITGEIREPTSREIAFSYQPPSALGSAEERVVLDSLNHFTCELPVIRGALVRAYCEEGRSSSSSNPAIVCTSSWRRARTRSVVVLSLSLDEDGAAWREAVDKHGIEGVHVRADGFGSDVAKSYQVNALPSYYLVDSQGLIAERLSGVRDTDEIVATIEKSL